MTSNLDSKNIINYLKKNPNFFEDNPDLISQIKFSTKLGAKTISLQEKQVEVLRDKIKYLESNLNDIKKIVSENDTINEKLNLWTYKIFLIKEDDRFPEQLINSFKNIFSVSEANLKIWDLKEIYKKNWPKDKQILKIKKLANEFQSPYCGPVLEKFRNRFHNMDKQIKSIAFICLKKPESKKIFGCVLFGSSDLDRFSNNLGNKFLNRIGDTLSASFLRFVV